jgi:hypothetical protein
MPAMPEQKGSLIPQLPAERMEELRVLLLDYLYKTGSPPDYAVRAAQIETDLGLTRDEMRAGHNHILELGYVAERARTGFIGLSELGQFRAKGLKEPDPED